MEGRNTINAIFKRYSLRKRREMVCGIGFSNYKCKKETDLLRISVSFTVFLIYG